MHFTVDSAFSVVKKYAFLALAFGAFGSVFGASASSTPPMKDLPLQIQATKNLQKASLMLEETKKLLENFPSITRERLIPNGEAFIAFFTEQLAMIIPLINELVGKCQNAVSIFATCPVSSGSLFLIIEGHLKGVDAVKIELDKYKKQIYDGLKIGYCKVCLSCPAIGDHVEISFCGKCQSVLYCSVKCQRKDWKAGHKAKCKKPSA